MIHVFNDADSKFCWRVWTDCDEYPETGRCIGIGKTKAEALQDAEVELLAELGRIQALLECESQFPTK